MKKSVYYAGLEIKSGEKLQEVLPVPGTDVNLPVTIINGVNDGKTIVVTAGIHSGEYVGIQCVVELAQQIDPKDVSGTVIFIHVCNPTGFEAQVSYIVPEDGKNLGRYFPGDPDGTLSEKICYFISSNFVNENCDMEIDLHGGDLHERLSTFVFAPKDGDEQAVKLSMDISRFMNVKYIVLTGGGMTHYALNQGIPSIVLERGDRGLWSKEEVDYYKKDVLNIFRFFEVIEGAVNYHGPEPYLFKKCDMVYAPVGGCWYRAVELEEHFFEGQKLGEIKDFHGNVLHTVYAKYDGVVHSYWAALSIREGQLMVGYGA